MEAITRSTFATGRKSSITSAVVLASAQSFTAKVGVTVIASTANTVPVYIGGSGVTADSADSTDGFPLYPGKQHTFHVTGPDKLYGVAGSSSKVFWFME